MMKINDLTIEELITVADDPSLTPDQNRKIKIYTLSRLQELENSGKLTPEQSKIVSCKAKEIKADVFGVDDMGYPYVPNGEVQALRFNDTQQHVDMYCGSESLF